MKCFLPGFSPGWAPELIRRFGYSHRHDSDGIESFIRTVFVTEAQYPRFHISVKSIDGGIQINLHLDQEDNQGHGNHQFVWSYHNSLVIEESRRLQSLAEVIRREIKIKRLLPPALYVTPAIVASRSFSKKIINFLSRRKILCKLF